MNKISFTIILSSIILISCASRSTDKTFVEKTVQEEVISGDNSFEDFIKKFSKDSVFQLTRIKFPIIYSYTSEDDDTGVMSTKQIQKEEWKMIDLVDKMGFGEEVKIIEEIKNLKTIDLSVNGVDTGLSITYCFEQENNIWYLVKIIDQSN